MKRLLEVLAVTLITIAMLFVEEPEVEPIISEEVVCLHEAIEIVKQEAEQYNNVLYSNNRKGN